MEGVPAIKAVEGAEPSPQLGAIKSIAELKRRYRAQFPVQALFEMATASWGESLFSPQTQVELVAQVCGDDVVKRFPPSAQYAQRFLKAYYSAVERHRMEVTDELLEALTAASTLAATSDHDRPIFRTFSLAESHAPMTVSVRETPMFTNVGLTTWGAAFYLAEYALAEPELFSGQKVLELGTGTGLTALWLLKCARPARLLLTDYVPNVLQNLRDNLAFNGFKEDETLGVQKLDWDHPDDLSFQPDVIIAADVVYDPPTVRALVKVLAGLLTANLKCRACIASTVRNPPTYAFFEQQLVEHQLTATYVMSSFPALFDYNRQNIRICWIHRAEDART